MSSGAADPDPADLLAALREAAAEPVRAPLRVPLPTTSQRRGPIGPLVTGVRRIFLRVVAPSLLELVNQLETDRTALNARIDALEERLSRLDGTSRDGTPSE